MHSSEFSHQIQLDRYSCGEGSLGGSSDVSSDDICTHIGSSDDNDEDEIKNEINDDESDDDAEEKERKRALKLYHWLE
jgi:hypothetical protein